MPGLIFDFDGLMIDSERVLADCLIDAIAEMGGAVTVADFGHLFGSTEAEDEWARLLPVWCGREVSLGELEARLTPVARALVDELPLLPGVADLIDEARTARWKLAIATGQSRDRLEPRLHRLGVWPHFDAVVTAAEVDRGKPAPDIFLCAAGRLGLEPAECTVLEDSLPGCQAALAAGMQVVVCPTDVSAHCEFPTHVRRVSSLAELTLTDLSAPGAAGVGYQA